MGGGFGGFGGGGGPPGPMGGWGGPQSVRGSTTSPFFRGRGRGVGPTGPPPQAQQANKVGGKKEAEEKAKPDEAKSSPADTKASKETPKSKVGSADIKATEGEVKPGTSGASTSQSSSGGSLIKYAPCGIDAIGSEVRRFSRSDNRTAFFPYTFWEVRQPGRKTVVFQILELWKSSQSNCSSHLANDLSFWSVVIEKKWKGN